MTAISTNPEPSVMIEPSSTTSALNDNSNSNNTSENILDDTSKRKCRYCPSDDGGCDDNNDVDDGENNEANCSGYDDGMIESSPVPTFPHIPWSRSRKYMADLEGLHYELLECYDWLRPTEAERLARCNVCQRVRNVLVDITPDAIFYVFGSVATNLFLPTSDIDISVELERLSLHDMQVVATAFRNSKNFKDVNVLDRAHVPIIKLTDRETNINIDISFNTSKAHYAVEYIMYMRYWYPALELFTLILKQFLASRHLNQAFTGGLSSYGLVLMIVHYMLRFYRSNFFMTDLSQLPIGIISKFFMGFLKYYGSEFNPLQDALAFPQRDEAVIMPKSYLTLLMNENFYASILCVQDPLTPMNDVGRGAHNFMQVKSAFYSAFSKLDDRIKKGWMPKSGEPMIQTIMQFSNSFIQFRRRINCLPFENIHEHNGNQPFTFGGQPPQPSTYENDDARNAVIYQPTPINQHLSPRLYFPSIPQHIHQQQIQQPSTFDESNDGSISIEQLSTSSSETSSTTPTAFSSPQAAADNNIINPPQENEYYLQNHPQMPPPQQQQQQIFFPPLFQHQQQRPEIYYPYFGISPPHHIQPLPPAYHFINDYGNSNSTQPPEYGYSESYYNEDGHQQQQEQIICEDDFDKMLSLADDDDVDVTKLNNGNVSDASSDSSSSGLSSGSAGSMISCSTVTPECYEEQDVTATQEGSSNLSSSGQSNI